MAKNTKRKEREVAADVAEDMATEQDESKVKDISSSTYSRWNPETKIMRSRYHVRKSQGGQKYTKTTDFDFNGCTEEDIMQLAMYGVRVRAQSELRDMDEETMAKPSTFAKCHVKDQLLSSKRTVMSEEEKFIRQAMKLGLSREIAEKALRDNLMTKEVAAQ